MQVSYSSGINQNIASTASYNWQTTNSGVGTTRMNIDVNRVKVSTIELAVSSQTSGQLRMIWSETGYGTFWRMITLISTFLSLPTTTLMGHGTHYGRFTSTLRQEDCTLPTVSPFQMERIQTT